MDFHTRWCPSLDRPRPLDAPGSVASPPCRSGTAVRRSNYLRAATRLRTPRTTCRTARPMIGPITRCQSGRFRCEYAIAASATPDADRISDGASTTAFQAPGGTERCDCASQLRTGARDSGCASCLRPARQSCPSPPARRRGALPDPAAHPSRPSSFAAYKPPNPPPTIRTRCRPVSIRPDSSRGARRADRGAARRADRRAGRPCGSRGRPA